MIRSRSIVASPNEMSFLIGIIAQRSVYERRFGKQQTLTEPSKKVSPNEMPGDYARVP